MRRRRRAQSRVTRTNRDENSAEPFKTKFTHLLSSFICCCQRWCPANERAELDIALLIHPRPMVKSTIYKHTRFKANFNDRRWRMHHIIQLTSKNQLLFKAIRQNSYLKKKKKKEWPALMSQLWAWGPLMKRHLHGQWSTSTRKAAGSLGSGIVWAWREKCWPCDPGPDSSINRQNTSTDSQENPCQVPLAEIPPALHQQREKWGDKYHDTFKPYTQQKHFLLRPCVVNM